MLEIRGYWVGEAPEPIAHRHALGLARQVAEDAMRGKYASGPGVPAIAVDIIDTETGERVTGYHKLAF